MGLRPAANSAPFMCGESLRTLHYIMKLREQLLLGFSGVFGLASLVALVSRSFAASTATAVAGLVVASGIGVTLYITRRMLARIGGEPAEIAGVIEQVARGNLEVEVGGDSMIAAAVAMMTATLKDVARQANSVASGDYGADVAPRSDKDELGLALRAMTAALRGVCLETYHALITSPPMVPGMALL